MNLGTVIFLTVGYPHHQLNKKPEFSLPKSEDKQES